MVAEAEMAGIVVEVVEGHSVTAQLAQTGELRQAVQQMTSLLDHQDLLILLLALHLPRPW